MSVSKINLSLKLGKFLPTAAPLSIMEALNSAQITQTDSGPCTFQLTFNADRTSAFSADYPILSSPYLKATNRVIISVTINSLEKVLMDGFITHTEINYSEQSGAATFTVTGEDISAMMNIYEFSLEYPGLGDDLIVEAVLSKYKYLSVDALVIPSLTSPISDPLDKVPVQNGTDRDYLNSLAQQNGYVFRVRPFLKDFNSYRNIAYWGPLIKVGLPQKVLNVNLGAATNVENLNFNYDALAGTLVHGMLQDNEPPFDDAPVITTQALRLQPMALYDGLTINQPFVRNTAFTDSKLGILMGLKDAQNTTDRSVEKVVSGSGTVDTLRYGDIIETPGVVPVRGMGASYDGNYYVSQVVHKISKGEYKQSFNLQREGLGSTIDKVGEVI